MRLVWCRLILYTEVSIFLSAVGVACSEISFSWNVRPHAARAIDSSRLNRHVPAEGAMAQQFPPARLGTGFPERRIAGV